MTWEYIPGRQTTVADALSISQGLAELTEDIKTEQSRDEKLAAITQ